MARRVLLMCFCRTEIVCGSTSRSEAYSNKTRSNETQYENPLRQSPEDELPKGTRAVGKQNVYMEYRMYISIMGAAEQWA